MDAGTLIPDALHPRHRFAHARHRCCDDESAVRYTLISRTDQVSPGCSEGTPMTGSSDSRDLGTTVRMSGSLCAEHYRWVGNRLTGTGVDRPAFSIFAGTRDGKERMVDQTGIEPVTS